MKTLFFILLLISTALAAQPSGISVGIAGGGISGLFGIGVRYWESEWGLQVSGLPYANNTGDETHRLLLASVQLLHRLSPPPNMRHEQSGYVHTSLYQYAGSGLIWSSFNSPQDESLFKLAGIGGGAGVETFWRNWRLATGIGLAVYLFQQYDPSVDISIYPTADFMLSYGF